MWPATLTKVRSGRRIRKKKERKKEKRKKEKKNKKIKNIFIFVVKEATSVPGPLPFTSSHGTPTSLTFWSSGRTLAKKRCEPVTSFMLSGFRTSS
jgi:hypothetical protein